MKKFTDKFLFDYSTEKNKIKEEISQHRNEEMDKIFQIK